MYNHIEEYISKSLSDGEYALTHWAGNGAIAALEDKLRSHYRAKHVLCVDSATNGLMYLLLAACLRRSEIITTPLSYGGTIAGALSLECKFHFADIDNSLNINPDSVYKILEQNKNIKAVIVVDFAGNPHDVRAMHQVCDAKGIWHFVDAAQSLGASYDSDAVWFCDALVVSFGSGKTIFAGGKGGAIVTNNTELYNRLVSICLHSHRQERDLGIGLSHEFALNGGIHPLSAVIACEMFEEGLKMIEEKRKRMSAISDILSSFSSVSSISSRIGSTYYHYPFIVEDDDLFAREFSASALRNDYCFRKAPFTPLPAQMERAGLSRFIKTSSSLTLSQIIDKLYVLHSK